MSNDEELFKEFRKRAYSAVDADGNQVIGVKKRSSELTISRLRRCQNCLNFDHEEKAHAYFRHCVERDRATLRDNGCAEDGIREHIQKLESGLRDNFGAVGICLIRDKRAATEEETPGDFVPFHFQCDSWAGRMIVTAQEAASDPSAAEVYANLKKVDQ